MVQVDGVLCPLFLGGLGFKMIGLKILSPMSRLKTNKSSPINLKTIKSSRLHNSIITVETYEINIFHKTKYYNNTLY